MKKLNVIGETYGNLTVVKEHSSSRSNATRYECRCSCGNICNILLSHLRQNNTTHCGCKTIRRIGSTHSQWTGVGEISGNFWWHLKRGASGKKRAAIELSITKEYAWDLFLKQERKCKLTDIDLKFASKWKDLSGTASLDRIDSSKGYIEGNVQWVHKDVNLMKNKLNNEYFIKVCKLIAINNQ